MSVAGSDNLAPRPSVKPLAWALLISLGVHLLAFVAIPGIYALLVALALVAKHQNPADLKRTQNPPKKEMVTEELPLVFVEVDPSQIIKEAPKNAKYYSSQNARAANPDAKVETYKPKIDGIQTHVAKTETVEKPKAFPLQPTPPKDTTPEAKIEEKPKGGPKVGDLAMAKPADKPADAQADAQVGEAPKHVRPRTITEAQLQKNQIQGQKMKQDGGVRQQHISASFDTKATTFGAYDAAFIDAVTKHWYDLVDAQRASQMRAGRVVLEFNLNYDGRITDMKVIANETDDLMSYLCQRSVLDPAPFEKWPNDMRRTIGSDRREVRFTFYYE